MTSQRETELSRYDDEGLNATVTAYPAEGGRSSAGTSTAQRGLSTAQRRFR